MATAERTRLTPAGARHLREMASDGPYWVTRHPGEVRCAETLKKLGLVASVWNRGVPTFEITDAGRAWVAAETQGDGGKAHG